jgi:hypothetical protein
MIFSDLNHGASTTMASLGPQNDIAITRGPMLIIGLETGVECISQ